MSNAGLFASVAREYANFRPGYPPELFDWLARHCASREAAWDCGCGSGQASVALAGCFDAVYATDVAAEQIAAAQPHPRVRYSLTPAESSGLADASVDLVTAAQSFHWFDVQAFYAEVRRVLRPGGLFAVWTYPRPQFEDARLDRAFQDFYADVVGPFWPPQRRHVESHYRSLPTPAPELGFDPLQPPAFRLELHWTPRQVAGYASSWSATAAYRQAHGTDPVPLLQQALRELWPDAAPTAALRMPLVLIAYRRR